MVKKPALKRLGIGPPGGGSFNSHSRLALLNATARPAVRPPAAPPTAGVPLPSAAAPMPAAVYPGARHGSMAAALQATASDAGMAEAVEALVRDKYAPKTHTVRATWLRTWLAMHAAAFRSEPPPPVPPFPLSPEIIVRVAAMFKAGGYLSFENYMLRAKSEHLGLGLVGPGSWSPELSAAVKEAIRSCNRGAGISRQSKPLDAVAVAALDLPDDPLVSGGPIAPADFVVAGCFFLLREVELAAAKAGHVTVSTDGSSVTWLLPTSKTDCRAVGVARTWDCCCAVPAMQPACPVCAISRQLARVRSAAVRLNRCAAEMPLFFAADGGEVERLPAVHTIFRLAELIGERITDDTGAYSFGGHSLRTGGAHLLASRGVNPFRIQSLGRWKSALVVHYAGESMATGIAQELQTSASGRSDTAALRELRRLIGKLNSRLDAVEAAESAPTDTVSPLPPSSSSSTAPAPATDRSNAFILNRDTSKVHRSTVPRSSEPHLWVTVCGWSYASRKYTVLDDIPRGTHYSNICPRCCSFERSLAANGELSEVD